MDIRYKMKMRISERMADFTQHFENLGIVVSKALGGNSDESAPSEKAKPTQNWGEAQMVLSDLFS